MLPLPTATMPQIQTEAVTFLPVPHFQRLLVRLFTKLKALSSRNPSSKSQVVRDLAKTRNGFTLLELTIVLVIIAILAILLLPAISGLRARAQKAQCAANLRSLYTAAELYIQQNGSWPQIAMSDSDSAEEDYAKAWIDALKPFGPMQKTWICPTIQNLLGNPDLSDSANVRIDYFCTSFDDKPTTPHQWPQQPWFAEMGDVHGNGQLIIFTDGSIKELKSFLKK
jgi:prepilin-type N-terminal cleavage/methylation domain-containing protein